jgi:predicted alpha/beta-fold hydrolase
MAIGRLSLHVDSTYRAPWFLPNRHAETIYPALLRRITPLVIERERIVTPDNDFLDIDITSQRSRKVVIISHGLEGNSRRAYVTGMARAFSMEGFDTLAWNYRGCGGEMNKCLRFYHSGATDDLEAVVLHAISKGYENIYLVGFSLGGNLTLKYLGESRRPMQVKGAVAFSVPMNLSSSCDMISQRANRVYALRFLRSLKEKVIAKSRIIEGLDIKGIANINTLRQFDDRYTAPIHGFRNAATYYQACSSINFYRGIQVPTLLVSARNDPFLAPDCYPQPETGSSLMVNYPQRGGHVGFALFNQNGLYWSELLARQFIGAI